MNPTTQLKPITAEGEQEFLTEISISDVYVSTEDRRATITTLWRYDIERKSKYINFNVFTKQARITLYNDEGKKLGAYDTLMNDEWTVQDKGLNLNDTIIPQYAEVDLEDKSIIINW